MHYRRVAHSIKKFCRKESSQTWLDYDDLNFIASSEEIQLQLSDEKNEIYNSKLNGCLKLEMFDPTPGQYLRTKGETIDHSLSQFSRWIYLTEREASVLQALINYHKYVRRKIDNTSV